MRFQARSRLGLLALRPILSELLPARSAPRRDDEFQRAGGLAEPQPQLVQQIYFIGGQVWRMWPKNFVDLVAVRQMNFQVKLRFLVAKIFPGIANFACLLFRRLPSAEWPSNNGAGFQRSGGAQDTVPQIIGRDDRQADRLASFFRQRKRLREKLLFDAAKKLLSFQFVFAGSRTPQQADVQAR